MPKNSLRQLVMARRAALAAEAKVVASSSIQAVFIALPEYLAADSIAVYAAVRGEVATDMVIRHALSIGKVVCLPAVAGEHLEFRRISGETDLVKGAFGIPEPRPGAQAFDPAAIGMIVVPGVVFDLAGQRIGYGKGYYDRALHKLESTGRLTAFCYECQLVDQIPGESHDVRMDRIITERRLLTPALLK